MSATGMAGFTLGGGMGFLRRKWGLACDNLVGPRSSRRRRGGDRLRQTSRSVLGVARRGRQLRRRQLLRVPAPPLGPEVYGAVVVYPGEQTAEVLRPLARLPGGGAGEVTCDLLLWGMPPLPMVPPRAALGTGRHRGRPVRRSGRGGRAGPAAGPRTRHAIADLSARSRTSRCRAISTRSSQRPALLLEVALRRGLTDEVITAITALAAERPSPQTLLGFAWPRWRDEPRAGGGDGLRQPRRKVQPEHRCDLAGPAATERNIAGRADPGRPCAT